MVGKIVFFLSLISVAFSIPSGYTTFFRGDDCPEGWAPTANTAGRLIVSVDAAADSDITVGKELSDMEARGHNHTIATTVYMDVKSISAIGCCNPDGACYGSYAMNGATTEDTSEMPYVQLLMCTLIETDNGTIPFGTIAYFSNASGTKTECSDIGPDWQQFQTASGRSLLPGYDTGLISSTSAPLKSGEDRVHNHAFSATVATNNQEYAGIAGCCDKKLAEKKDYTVNSATGAASANIPFTQLLTCVSLAQTFEVDLPNDAYIFSEVSCPPGYRISEILAGRYLVSLPEGGRPGAVFGGSSLLKNATLSNNHDHPFNTAVNTKECEVGLASGCCGSGYVKNQQYVQSGITATHDGDFPFLSIPICEAE